MKNLKEKLWLLESSKIDTNIYCLSVGKSIKSYVVIDLSTLNCSLNHDTGLLFCDNSNLVYRSFYKLKSEEKAINLLLRIKKDFAKCNRKFNCPTLKTMESLYNNYFEKELTDLEIDQEENLCLFH